MKFLFLGALLLGSAYTTYAQTDYIFESFKYITTVASPSIVVPTVLEVPIVHQDERLTSPFAIVEQQTGRFVGYYLKHNISERQSYSVIIGDRNEENLIDENSDTYVQFDLVEGASNSAEIKIVADTPVTFSGFTADLDAFVALPHTVSVFVHDEGVERVVLARQRMNAETIRFLKTTGKEWRIVLEYAQPLRISEVRMIEEGVTSTVMQSLRFLAQPNSVYTIYADADRSVSMPTQEAGNLHSDEGVRVLPVITFAKNPTYVPSDVDEDSVFDMYDNCVYVKNSGQEDVNNNGRGDVCDDDDRDGHINSLDNCPQYPNRDQRDTDGDGTGDVCDGEESRFTEKNTWIPWAGMGIAFFTIATLFITVYRKEEVKKKKAIEQNT